MTADAVGGVWTYALELSRALASFGTRVTLATMGPRPSDSQRRAARGIPGLDLVESDWKLEWADNAWGDVDRAGEWLLRLEESLRPDIVHLNGYAHAALTWCSPRIVVAHSCVPSWRLAVHGGRPTGTWHGDIEMVAGALAAADLVIAPTAVHLRTIEAIYGPCPGARASGPPWPQPVMRP